LSQLSAIRGFLNLRRKADSGKRVGKARTNQWGENQIEREAQIKLHRRRVGGPGREVKFVGEAIRVLYRKRASRNAAKNPIVHSKNEI